MFGPMIREACVEIGYISKAHGLEGELKATLDVHDMEEYLDVPVLYLAHEKGPLRPYAVEVFHVMDKKHVLLTLTEVDDRPEAEALVGQSIFFPQEDLPPLAEGHFYFFQVIGFRVEDATMGTLGTIQDFASGGSQDVMIMDYEGHEVLIPVVDEIVGLADFDKKVVFTQLPEGLVDMYLGRDEDDGDDHSESV